MYLNALILILCISTLIVYTRTKNYDSINGILIIIFGLSALLLTILYLKEVTFKLYVPETLLMSGIIHLVFTIVGFLLVIFFRVKQRKFNPVFFLTLFVLYVPFAFLQQIFFQYIFLNTLSSLIASRVLVFLLGISFFGLAHPPRDTIKLTIFSLMAGTVWIWTFMTYGNLLWQSLSHAFLGALYYCLVHPDNRLVARLKFLEPFY